MELNGAGYLFASDLHGFVTETELTRWNALKEIRSMPTIRWLIGARPSTFVHIAYVNNLYDTCTGKIRDEWRAKCVELMLVES